MNTRLIDIMAMQETTTEMDAYLLANGDFESAYDTMVENAREARRQFDTLTAERDAALALLRECEKFFGGWCPNQRCCASSAKDLHRRLAAMIGEGEKPHRVDGIAVDPMCDYCGERHEGQCEDDSTTKGADE